MTRAFRFGVQLTKVEDQDSIASYARQAEDLGYDDIYSFDHFGMIDPFVPLMVAAGATTTLRVGTLVLNNELHHPALLARTVASVDRMTGGRFVLGIGTGYAQAEHDALNIELRPPPSRVERLEESLRALRSLLDDGSVTLRGGHHQLQDAELGIRPLQPHVPVLIGGHGRRVVEVSARHADIFQFTGLTHAHDGTPQAGGFALESVAERASWLTEAAGPRNDQIERSVLVQHVNVGDDARTTVDDVAQRVGLEPELVSSSPFLLVGAVNEVVERLQGLRETLGVSHFVIRGARGFAPIVSALAGT